MTKTLAKARETSQGSRAEQGRQRGEMMRSTYCIVFAVAPHGKLCPNNSHIILLQVDFQAVSEGIVALSCL